jgi:aryl-alcohol dehydrogenase-like predicted oxidoreductase
LAAEEIACDHPHSGTLSIEHLDQNVGACDVELSHADMTALDRLERIPAG